MSVGEIDTAVFKAALSAAEPVSANLNVFVCYDGVIFATENSAKEYCKDRNFALGGMGYNKKPLQGDFTHPALSAHVQDVTGWRMPLGSKRALVDELQKARSDFMISDFEIAERIIAAIETLAAAPAKQEG